MIPKIIHYCWFGNEPKSKTALKCIESWRKLASDFEIKEWNEHNTKRYQNKFYRDAYRKKKYAFVADTIRVSVLYEFGGIYIDLDMLLLKPLNHLIKYNFFSGYEVEGRTAYGLFGGVARHRFFEEMYQFYRDNYFNQFSLPVITHIFSSKINKSALSANEKIFDPEFFYALTYQSKDKDYSSFITPNSMAIHLWDHSWEQKEEKQTIINHIKNINTVCIDYIFYAYPKSYFIRYFRGNLRKVLYKLFVRA